MKVTIISLDNWGFNNYIAQALKEKGIETTVINFNEFKYEYSSFYKKAFNFVLKNLSKHNLKEIHLKNQIEKRIKPLPKQDKILVIKSDFLNLETLSLLKTKTDSLITYINDSLSRCPKVKKNIHMFDKVYSFEDRDCKKYGFKKINNFIYSNLRVDSKNPIEYEVFNISSIHKRKKSVELFADYFNSKAISFKLIMFSSKFKKNLDSRGITLINKPYSIPEMIFQLKKCKIILDLQRPKQRGLSFRVFESLAYNKKLITLNKDISKYDFYDPQNIHIVNDIHNINIPDSFIKSEYKEIEKKILTKYHVSNWVKQVFELS
ncbi:MAG: hypothetical protein GVY05_00205 [Bacteroidetes bacterium]|jgi:hypothetical protein|nr:hypothetical protein [Bacteroidota bacterium]